MKKILFAAALLCAASGQADDFVRGADLGWLTEMEANGKKFYNAAGQEREGTALMKELGMNAVRCRVWVDPSSHGNYCTMQDVLVKAQRAKNLGMDVMIDFHYSDWWADPGKQNVPARWSGLAYATMKDSVAHHTTEVLTYLKANGITPRWVQVGNETSNGLLWPTGQADKNPRQYAGFISAGYAAVKAVFPEAIVVVHLDNGWNQSLYDWNLGLLKTYGAQYDMIGMSLYPTAAVEWNLSQLTDVDGNGSKDAYDVIAMCMVNVRHVSAAFDKPVMITEIGVQSEDATNGKAYVARTLQAAREETDGRCKGVFYWEPEAGSDWEGYKLGAFTNEGYPTAIMEAFSEDQATGIGALPSAPSALVDVYAADGKRMRTAVPRDTAMQGLTAGLYVVGGKKVLVK